MLNKNFSFYDVTFFVKVSERCTASLERNTTVGMTDIYNRIHLIQIFTSILKNMIAIINCNPSVAPYIH